MRVTFTGLMGIIGRQSSGRTLAAAGLALALLGLGGGCAKGAASSPDGAAPQDGELGPPDARSTDADGAVIDPDGPFVPGPCGGKSCDDQLSCTADTCVNSTCLHQVLPGFCLVQKVCHADGQKADAASCRVCRAGVSSTSWTEDSSLCADDGLSCTAATCAAGMCAQQAASGFCIIGNACITSGAADPTNSCSACDPSKSTAAYHGKSDGAACASDGVSCTSDTCQGGACAHALTAGKCLIGGSCFSAGQTKPGAGCSSCNPGAATAGWTTSPDGTACPGGKCLGGACCPGCIAGSTCMPGTTTSHCGAGGAPCAVCSPGYTCGGGGCISSPTYTLNIGTYKNTYSSSNATRGYWFTAPKAFTIVGLRVPTDVGTAVQTIQVVRLFSPPPTFSAGATSAFTSLSYLKGIPGTGYIGVNIPVAAGWVVGILGARGTTTLYNSYGQTNTHNTTLGGSPIMLKRLLLQKNLYSQPADLIATEDGSSYSRIELQYKL